MQQLPFEGRCIEQPLLPCACGLKEFCRRTDRTLGINLTSHGQVTEDLLSGDPVRVNFGRGQVREWKNAKEHYAAQTGQDISVCPR